MMCSGSRATKRNTADEMHRHNKTNLLQRHWFIGLRFLSFPEAGKPAPAGIPPLLILIRCMVIIGHGDELVNYWMRVPVSPEMPSRAFSSNVMSAARFSPDSAKSMAASILGSMEPGAKCPSAM